MYFLWIYFNSHKKHCLLYAQLRSAMFYFSSETPPAWINIEQASVPNLPLMLYLYSADPRNLKKGTENPFLKNTIDIWYKAHQHIRDTPPISCLSPIWGNTRFKPGRADGGFRIWADSGVQKIKDLYRNGKLLTFDQICHTYGIPKKHFFKYLQLRNFILSKHKDIMSEPTLSHIENLTLQNQEGRGQVSLFYSALLHFDKESTIDRLEAWRLDVQEDIQETDWQLACERAQKQSINTRMRLLQYKWLMRTYITPVKLNSWSPNVPDTCSKCLVGRGTLFHCVWDCPNVKTYWETVVDKLSEIVGMKVPHQAKLCVLGIYPDNFVVSLNHSTLIDFGLLQARRLIALYWKKMDMPSINLWVKEMSSCIVFEKLTYLVRGKAREFERVWESLVKFISDQGAG